MSEKQPPVRLPRRAWITGGVVLVATIAAEPFVHLHPHFGVDGGFAFHAWYGFGACALMVLFAKLVAGKLLSRGDDHYDG